MHTPLNFWAAIAQDISQFLNHRHPSHWKKADIEAFLIIFMDKIREICKQDDQKACLVLNVKQINDLQRRQIESLDLSYDTFRNIFHIQRSSGRPSTKHMFAIYLGYDSFQDYIAQKGLAEGTSAERHPSLIPHVSHDLLMIGLKPIYILIIERAFLLFVLWLIFRFLYDVMALWLTS